MGLAAGGKETPRVRPPDRQPRPQWAAWGTALTATRSAPILSDSSQMKKPNPHIRSRTGRLGIAVDHFPSPDAPGAGRLLSAPASARIATRLAGPRVGAFWKPGDPALISSPGQPDSAHGRPALVDRQNPVLTTGPVWLSGDETRQAVKQHGEDRLTGGGQSWPCGHPNDREALSASRAELRRASDPGDDAAMTVRRSQDLPGVNVRWTFKFGLGSGKAEHGPLTVPGKRQT